LHKITVLRTIHKGMKHPDAVKAAGVALQVHDRFYGPDQRRPQDNVRVEGEVTLRDLIRRAIDDEE
jgi:hypothetical protein